MRLTSLLFVPADSDRKFAKAQNSGATGLILDLEDSVALAGKDAARTELAHRITAEDRPWDLWVRVNPLDSGMVEADLAAAVRPGLDGIMLPKAEGGADVDALAQMIAPLEQAAGIIPGHIKIIVVATETAGAMFNLASYAPAHPRLAALTWGAEDLSAVVGATDNRDQNGDWTSPYQMARSLCLFAAANAGIPAVDTIYADFRNTEGLSEAARAARRDGFVGQMAIHPAQIDPINTAYTPSDADLALARRIVEAFDADSGLGTIGIDGKMYDIPHLKRARLMLDITTPTPTAGD